MVVILLLFMGLLYKTYISVSHDELFLHMQHQNNTLISTYTVGHSTANTIFSV